MTPEEFSAYVAARKGSLPNGPWKDEPDRLEFKTEEGFDALIVRQPLGHLCGYVAVRKGHPAYGKHYDDVDVMVHGGLTYADFCFGHICHKSDDEHDPVYWLGFDCGHGGDLIPRMLEIRAINPELATPEYQNYIAKEKYRKIDYVKGEISKLSKQLAGLMI